MRLKRGLTFTVVVIVACWIGAEQAIAQSSPSDGPPRPNADDAARVILQRYADAWRGEQEMLFTRDLVLAFWIRGEGGGEYHILLPQREPASLRDGIPGEYDLGFELESDFLRKLDRGEINALTAMGQARSSDPTPLVPKLGPGLGNDPDAPLVFRRLSFHFWNRDWPETVRFGDGTTREVHGGNATVFYYDNELRSAWYQIRGGMHINADPALQKNDYLQMVIVTRGQFRARFDGQERLMTEGQTVLIPSGMASEFWADPDQYGEFVWLGFGPGA